MIGLDTNVLVRYLVEDDLIQSPRAVKLIESLNEDDPAFISLVVIVELVWVLDARYRYKRDDIAHALEGLLTARELRVASAAIVWEALRAFRQSKADFADCLIARGNLAAGCDYTATFDEKAGMVEGMKLLR